MAKKYELKGCLKEVDMSASLGDDVPSVEVLSSSEFTALNLSQETQATLKELSKAESTYLDVFPNSLIASFAVPKKDEVIADPLCFAFYLDKMRLIFVDDGQTCVRVMGMMVQIGVLKHMTVAHCLFEFMKLLIHDDLAFLADIEDQMEDFEEQIIDRDAERANRSILLYRRRLLRINTFYQQLVDMDSTMSENENRLFSHQESHLFFLLARQSERLLQRSQTLKEYSLQLLELYQTQIDLQLNSTMKIFTVITLLFAPLTLITSWFGMNFENMPGLNSTWGYYFVVGLSVCIVILELYFFKRKRWL